MEKVSRETYFLHLSTERNLFLVQQNEKKSCTANLYISVEKNSYNTGRPRAPEKKGGGELQNWHTVGHRKLEFQTLACDFNRICRFHIDEILERAAIVEDFK